MIEGRTEHNQHNSEDEMVSLPIDTLSALADRAELLAKLHADGRVRNRSLERAIEESLDRSLTSDEIGKIADIVRNEVFRRSAERGKSKTQASDHMYVGENRAGQTIMLSKPKAPRERLGGQDRALPRGDN